MRKLVEKHSTNSLLWSILLNDLESCGNITIPGLSVNDIFHEILPVMARNFWMSPMAERYAEDWLQDLNAPDGSNEIALLVANALKHAFDAYAIQILGRIQDRVSTTLLPGLQRIFMPFLIAVPKELKKIDEPLTSIDWPSLYKTLVAAYFKLSVGPRPTHTFDRSRRCTRCSCQDCAAVNVFLIDKNTLTRGFQLHTRRRDHIMLELSRCGTEVTHHVDSSPLPYKLIINKKQLPEDDLQAEWHKRWSKFLEVEKQVGLTERSAALGFDDEDAMYTCLARETMMGGGPPWQSLMEVATNAGTIRRADGEAPDEPPAKRPQLDFIDLT